MSPSKLPLQPFYSHPPVMTADYTPLFFFHFFPTQKVHIVQFLSHVCSSKREEVSVPSLRREHESLSVSTSSLILEFNPDVQIFSPHPRSHLTKCLCAAFGRKSPGQWVVVVSTSSFVLNVRIVCLHLVQPVGDLWPDVLRR